jgi:hypothetical protein
MCENLPIIVGLKKQAIFTRGKRQQDFSDSCLRKHNILENLQALKKTETEIDDLP